MSGSAHIVLDGEHVHTARLIDTPERDGDMNTIFADCLGN